MAKEIFEVTARVPTNLRTLLILETVAEAPAPLTASEIGRAIGLPKQTIHRLCATLEREGFLVRHPGGRHFQPSRRLARLAGGILNAARFRAARRKVLEAFAGQVRETVNLVVPAEEGMRYIDRVETDWPFRVQLPIGSHVPFHCTASGKTFLASLPERQRRAMVESMRLEPHTAHTLTRPEALLEELAEVARQGYATDREEFFEGMVALAVPVTDPAGRYLAALAFHGPRPRLTVEGMLEHLPQLRAAAEKVRDALLAEIADAA